MESIFNNQSIQTILHHYHAQYHHQILIFDRMMIYQNPIFDNRSDYGQNTHDGFFVYHKQNKFILHHLQAIVHLVENDRLIIHLHQADPPQQYHVMLSLRRNSTVVFDIKVSNTLIYYFFSLPMHTFVFK
jgi:hypothetical protein